MGIFEYEEGSILDPRAFQKKPLINGLPEQSKPFKQLSGNEQVRQGTKTSLNNASKMFKSAGRYFSPQGELERTRAQLSRYKTMTQVEKAKQELSQLRSIRMKREQEEKESRKAISASDRRDFLKKIGFGSIYKDKE